MKRRDIKRLGPSERDSAIAKDRAEAIEGIKRGLESMKRNAGKPAEKFFRQFFAEERISERE